MISDVLTVMLPDAITDPAGLRPLAHALEVGSLGGLAAFAVLASAAAAAVQAWKHARRTIDGQAEELQRTRPLAAIVEHSHDAIIGKDLNGVITNWNSAAEGLFGYTAGEAVGRSIEIIVPPERKPQFQAAVERVKQGDVVDYVDTVGLHKSGTRVPLASRMSPIRDGRGQLVGTAKISFAVASRRRRENALRFLSEAGNMLFELGDHRKAMFNVARCAVSLFADACVVRLLRDEEHVDVVAWAHADAEREAVLSEFLALQIGDWNDSPLVAETLVSGRSQLAADANAMWMAREPRGEEQRRLLADLAPRSIIVSPIVVRGQTIGVLEFLVEGSRHYEPADTEVAEEIARRAATIIENAQLYEQLQHTQRQRDDFLALLAHELRNPLAAIQYANQVAKMSDSEPQGMTEIIDRQVTSLARLIDDLLDVSRLERNKIRLTREFIDGTTLLQRAVATARPAIEERQHVVTLELSETPVPLHVDAARVEQILGNLLNNAAKYTPQNGQITASCQVHQGDAVFQVRDSGIGMPKEMLPHVFELFTQLDNSLDRSQGGLGIGLTVVRKLAELHGGTVSAASGGIGLGSTFTVRLPLADQVGESQPAPQNAAIAKSSQRVLVVDDDFDTARTMARLLEIIGHQVQIAHEGPAALVAARSFQPHVILLDLGLPGLDGYRVAEILREEGLAAEIRLIAISGYGQAEDRRRSREAGFDRHLVKPVDFNELAAIIAEEDSGA